MMQSNLCENQNKNVMVIGITGGVGTGKSKVLTYLEEQHSCKVIQADIIANKLKEPGNACYQSTIDLLGKEILTADGRIDNRKMGKAIFSSPELLKKINELIHPEVKNEIKRIINDEESKGKIDFLFIEAALLIEAEYLDILDACWFVYSSDKVRRDRLKQSRGYSNKKINEIMNNQLSDSEFEKSCDVIIDNSGLWMETEKQIANKMEEYLWKKK